MLYKKFMDVFHALAEPKRRHIVEILAKNGRLSATEISDNFRITPQATSQHLKILLKARVLHMEKNAQQRIYRINPDSILEMEKWTRRMENLWSERFDRLDKVLESEMKKKR